MTTCIALDCDRQAVARGLCKMHHKRLMKHGNAEHRHEYAITPLADKLAAKSEPDTVTGCLNWTGGADGDGYGQVSTKSDDGKWHLDRAHRAAWRLAYGDIPGRLCVLHKCDNPRCINADHLFLGTRRDNVVDMDTKGRRRNGVSRGARHGMAKLTVDDVHKIRAIYADGETQAKIATEFGVRQAHVSKIVRRTVWSHLTAADVKLYSPDMARETLP